jgi:hypothetical protein
MLHTQHCWPVAVAGASCLWLPGLKGMAPRGYRASLMAARAATAAKAVQCFAAKNGARQRPSPGRRARASSKQRTSARLCMDLYTHSATLLTRSLSFVANHPPPPQPPPDSPLNVALLCLPCLLLSSSRFPCKQTNNKKSSAFKSALTFSLHCSYSRN